MAAKAGRPAAGSSAAPARSSGVGIVRLSPHITRFFPRNHTAPSATHPREDGPDGKPALTKPARRRILPLRNLPHPHGGGDVEATARPSSARARPVYQTEQGTMYTGLAEDVLARPPLTKQRGRVQMLFTSPPFPLLREKKYGNLQGDAFARWLAGFAKLFSEY